MALDFLAGCIGGGAGVLVGHPLDTVKVRLQIQDHKNPVYKGTWRTASQIFRQEGIKGLYSGVTSPLGGMAFINAIIFGVYGNVLHAVEARRRRGAAELERSEKLMAVGVAGSAAGMAQVVVCAPMELAKIRLQIPTETKVYRSITDCLVKVFKKDGLRGLYKGLSITVVRELPSFFVYFYVYEALMMQTGGSTAMMMVNGGIAGCCSWVSVYPVDVVKTRMQMDGMGDLPPRYRSSWHCLREGYAEQGSRFLFRGINSTLARAFPVNAVTFSVVTWILQLRNWDASDLKLK